MEGRLPACKPRDRAPAPGALCTGPPGGPVPALSLGTKDPCCLRSTCGLPPLDPKGGQGIRVGKEGGAARGGGANCARGVGVRTGAGGSALVCVAPAPRLPPGRRPACGRARTRRRLRPVRRSARPRARRTTLVPPSLRCRVASGSTSGSTWFAYSIGPFVGDKDPVRAGRRGRKGGAGGREERGGKFRGARARARAHAGAHCAAAAAAATRCAALALSPAITERMPRSMMSWSYDGLRRGGTRGRARECAAHHKQLPRAAAVCARVPPIQSRHAARSAARARACRCGRGTAAAACAATAPPRGRASRRSPCGSRAGASRSARCARTGARSAPACRPRRRRAACSRTPSPG